MALSYLQVCWVAVVVYTKWTAFVDKAYATGKLTTEADYIGARKLCSAFGMQIKKQSKQCDSTEALAAWKTLHPKAVVCCQTDYCFEIDHWRSCIPDFIFLFVFLLYLYAQYAAYHRRENAIEHRINILLIKNYELVVKDEEEETTVNNRRGES